MSQKPYNTHSIHGGIDDFVAPDNVAEWSSCPRCNLKPKIWIFDNGRYTACGCWNNRYDHLSIQAESIMSVYTRTGGKGMDQHDRDDLRKNWNHWCLTGEILFQHASRRNDGRW